MMYHRSLFLFQLLRYFLNWFFLWFSGFCRTWHFPVSIECNIFFRALFIKRSLRIKWYISICNADYALRISITSGRHASFFLFRFRL